MAAMLLERAGLPLQRVNIRLPGAAGPVRIAYRHQPANDPASAALPVLLVHGLGLSSYSCRYVQAALGGSRSTYAIDLVGFGRSDKPRGTDTSLPGLARSLFHVLDALEIERAAF